MPDNTEGQFDANGMWPWCMNPHSGKCSDECAKRYPEPTYTQDALPTRCADVGWKMRDDLLIEQRVYSSQAKPGDLVWSYGKNGGSDVLGHVVVRVASCETDPRYCEHYFPSDHYETPMCECGDMHRADHHWTLLRRANA